MNSECWLCVLASGSALATSLWSIWLGWRVSRREFEADMWMQERLEHLEEWRHRHEPPPPPVRPLS